MITYIITTVSIIYIIYNQISLNREINIRLNYYKVNSKNIKSKPTCKKGKMVCFFICVALVMLLLVLISQAVAIIAWGIVLIFNYFVRRSKIIKINQLDSENFSYWCGGELYENEQK